MPLANDTLLPLELWAATGMAAWRAALDLTTSVASASAAVMAGASASASGQSPATGGPGERKPEYRARSWYKAPYRSPFDPLFWMSPGHPVDHMGEWINLLRNASSAVPGFPAAFTPLAAPTAATGAQFLFPWLSMIDMMSRNVTSAGSSSAHDNIVDFASAYAAYRTAGGHAAAQIIRGGNRPPAASPSNNEAASATLPFPMALFLPIWMR